MNSDPASLQNLNPIVLPDPVPLWPPAPGWYVVIAIVLAVAAWLTFKAIRRWRANAYRRAALREFRTINADKAEAGALAGLLKRAALSAFPRDQVATLSGAPWHEFLDRTAGRELFAGRCGAALDAAAYNPDQVGEGEAVELRAATLDWLRHHKTEAGSG